MTTPARAAAYATLLREETERERLDLSWAATPESAGLAARDRSLAFELVTGTLRRRGSIDAVMRSVADIDFRRVSVGARVALRMGAFQLLFLDRVPAHAAVSESVSLVAPEGRRTAGFVNAVLRRVADDGRETFARLSAGDDVGALAVKYSHPDWLVEGWLAELGREAAETVLAAGCAPPERCLRVNRRRATPEQARASLAGDGVATATVADFPDALLAGAGPALETTSAFREGLVTAQSRGSQLVGHVVAEGARQCGDPVRVLDLCAAPGGKTAHLAALLPQARITACDIDLQRAAAMQRNLERLGVRAESVVADATTLSARTLGGFAAVLVDAPCSGLGILASRPELRWRRRVDTFARRDRRQHALLASAAALVAPGGRLTYAVCTLTRRETVDVVGAHAAAAGWAADDLAAERPEYRDPWDGRFLATLPGRHGSSGFFVARLRRLG